MIDAIWRDETQETPKIIFDKENHIFQILGRSLLINAADFFDDLIEWIKKYVSEPNPYTEVKIFLEYMNSSSVRKMVELLVEFEKIMDFGGKVKICWFYRDNDDLTQEKGDELKSVIRIPVELISLSKTFDLRKIFIID
jgi:hypothetical protein